MLQLDDNKATYQIRAFKPGMIQINELILTNSVIVLPQQLIENWPPISVATLTPASFNLFLTLKPDVLLIGTGSESVFLDPALYGELINARIGVEVMNTSAACRTYNALCADNRHVAAALLL